MNRQLEQASQSLEEAEAALALGNFDQFQVLLLQTAEILDTALNQINDSTARINELHELQVSFEGTSSADEIPEETPEDVLAMVA